MTGDGPPLSERELFRGLRGDPDAGILLTPAAEVAELLELIARETATCRELLELLVDWAGARDRPSPGLEAEAALGPSATLAAWSETAIGPDQLPDPS